MGSRTDRGGKLHQSQRVSREGAVLSQWMGLRDEDSSWIVVGWCKLSNDSFGEHGLRRQSSCIFGGGRRAGWIKVVGEYLRSAMHTRLARYMKP